MKKYTIDGIDFFLKDITLDEAEEVNAILKLNSNGIEITNEESKKFLEIVLEPVVGNNKIIDFGKCKEQTAVEVLQDFLLRKIERGEELKSSFTTSISGMLKRLKKQKP